MKSRHKEWRPDWLSPELYQMKSYKVGALHQDLYFAVIVGTNAPDNSEILLYIPVKSRDPNEGFLLKDRMPIAVHIFP